MNKPIPESYWVVPGTFLAGAYPFSRFLEFFEPSRLAAFLEAGFNTFFDLTWPGERPPYLDELQEEAARYGISISYSNVNIQDRGMPSKEQMAALLDSIDASLIGGGRVYLHCVGGIGRTGMVVGCWLVRHGRSGAQALQYLQELYNTSVQSLVFTRAPETDAQARFVLEWEG